MWLKENSIVTLVLEGLQVAYAFGFGEGCEPNDVDFQGSEPRLRHVKGHVMEPPKRTTPTWDLPMCGLE